VAQARFARVSAVGDIAAGTLFAGEYLILEKLSEGGMGAVYVAEPQSTKKRRALKLMLPVLVQHPKMRERFAREAQVAARIESDHVVEAVGAGIDGATGLPWLAMELLQGEELGALIERRGAMPPIEVAEIMRQLCDGVGAAHAAGIVHRDLKPENVFLARARRSDVPFTVKILDFGIAGSVASRVNGPQPPPKTYRSRCKPAMGPSRSASADPLRRPAV
jgi:serine/threonine-protein kinase